MTSSPTQPRLLVSVRNDAEALAALAGEADIIDVKEPNNGALGAASPDVVSAIVRAVAGRAMVTAALGELIDPPVINHSVEATLIPAGVSLFKLGLARCAQEIDWPARWEAIVSQIASATNSQTPRPVAVVYADWQAARAPDPRDVLQVGVELGCPALLVDTWDKSAGGLFDHWRAEDLRDFIEQVRKHNLLVVLAGSLTGESFHQAACMNPDFVAVRGAACEGGRRGAVSAEKVRALKVVLNSCKAL